MQKIEKEFEMLKFDPAELKYGYERSGSKNVYTVKRSPTYEYTITHDMFIIKDSKR